MNDRMKWQERSFLKSTIRSFFTSRSYLEIDTPILVRSPGTEVNLNYFETIWTDHTNTSSRLFLRSSPELHMKQALSQGLSRIFQFSQCFRNVGERSPWHQPEFTMLEWYEMGLGYMQLIDQTESLIQFAAQEISNTFGIDLANIIPDKFVRMSVFEAFEEFVGIQLVDNDDDLAKKAAELGIVSVNKHDSFEDAYFKCLIERIEPRIAERKGIVLYDYPQSQAALSVVEDNRAQRFEFYLGRVELCNGFHELMGKDLNAKRIEEASRERQLRNMPEVPIDHDFLNAMDRIVGSCSGNALGFERLLAVLLREENIDCVVPFRNASAWNHKDN